MRFALFVVAGALTATTFAVAGEGNLRRRHDDGVRRTKSGNCVIRVVKLFKEKVFECEMDPVDVGGEAGVTRAIDGTPQQMATLKAMLDSGVLAAGKKNTLDHGSGAEFDDKSLFLPPDASVLTGAGSRRLQKGKKKPGKGSKSKPFVLSLNKSQRGNEEGGCQLLADTMGGEVGKVFASAILSGCQILIPQGSVTALSSSDLVTIYDEDADVTMYAAASWGLDRIDQTGLPLDEETTKMDANFAKVYILDTGVQGDHPDFDGMIGPSGCHHSSITSEPDPLSDGQGHGTHVASTSCGHTYGVADNCVLCAVKVLSSSGSGSYSGVIAGVEHAYDNCQGNEKCVINMSLGGPTNTVLNQQIDAAVADGVVVAVAAGNDQDNACNYSPASAEKAITVGSTDSSDNNSYFTNFGDCVNVHAPGSNIMAARHTGGATSKSGTSMASPHVAGIAAGLFGAGAASNPTGILNVILANAVDFNNNKDEHKLATIFSSPAPPPAPTSPPAPCVADVDIEVTTDNYGSETSWALKALCDGGTVLASGDNLGNGQLYTETVCVAPGEYEFTIEDSYGDGICCSYGEGHYKVSVENGETYEGGQFTSSVTHTWGDCDTGATSTAATATATTSAAFASTTAAFASTTAATTVAPPFTTSAATTTAVVPPPPPPSPTLPPVPSPTPPPVPSPTPPPVPGVTSTPTFFSCAQFNEEGCIDAYGGEKCQWVGDCQNCGCVPVNQS